MLMQCCFLFQLDYNLHDSKTSIQTNEVSQLKRAHRHIGA